MTIGRELNLAFAANDIQEAGKCLVRLIDHLQRATPRQKANTTKANYKRLLQAEIKHHDRIDRLRNHYAELHTMLNDIEEERINETQDQEP